MKTSKKKSDNLKACRTGKSGEHNRRKLSGKLLQSMRFSLAFRIAAHFIGQLMRTTLPYLLLFTLLYCAAQAPGILRAADRTISSQSADCPYNVPLETYQYEMDVYLSRQILPQNTELIREQLSLVFSDDLFHYPPLMHFAVQAPNGAWMFTVNLASRLEVYLYLAATLVLFDILRSLGFLRHRNRLGKTVLKPIREITDMAATLSAHNLSNRINIAGTKNELKDLALVINTMLDRIERSYNSQRQFVSDASHELRTPIAVIQGYINMLNRWGRNDPSVLDESLNAIAQEMNSMKDLVESLLFLARHDKKTLLLETEAFDPCEVMAAVHREAKLVSSHFSFTLEPLEHCSIRADKNMIKQVLRILCDNAVKYSPEGGTITLGVRAAGDGCILTVADTGAGIAPEDLPKIFDRFYRADAARKAPASGHGLGLSIARIIILAHNGKFSVKSKVGAGSVFTIELPGNAYMLMDTLQVTPAADHLSERVH